MNLTGVFKLFTQKTDDNCVQIVAPDPIVPADNSNFGSSERQGNVSREAAKVLVEFMDN